MEMKPTEINVKGFNRWLETLKHQIAQVEL